LKSRGQFHQHFTITNSFYRFALFFIEVMYEDLKTTSNEGKLLFLSLK
jgi:hypothetical protein